MWLLPQVPLVHLQNYNIRAEMSRNGNMEHDQLRMLGYTSISGNCFTHLISHTYYKYSFEIGNQSSFTVLINSLS